MKKYFILLIAILLGVPSLLYGQSDIVLIVPPNAMILFDSSSSMNSKSDGSYPGASWKLVDKDGNVSPAGTAPWKWYPFEGGGNHPDSKLYEAKLALKWVIKDLVDINLGFSTYAQFKNDVRVGRYIRDRWDCTGGQSAYPPTCWSNKLYWQWHNYSHSITTSPVYQPYGTFDAFGQHWTGMSVGSTLTETNHTFDNNSVQPSGNTPPPPIRPI